ncbi:MULTISPECIES: hypothetical protein [unclassified Kribbella]|uniref:hypothetical protein n=1 Tax=unclassified Kribbella TaxID=2644121 RepID=UPI003077C956
MSISSGALVFAVAAGLGADASTGAQASDAFVESAAWDVWRLVAATASVLFLALLLTAVHVLRNANEWGVTGSELKLWPHLAFGILGTAVLILGRIVVGGGTPELPVKALEVRVGAVLTTSLLAGIPWVVLVWLAHETCHLLQQRIEELPSIPPVLESSSKSRSKDMKPSRRDVIEQLLRLWRLIELCVGAFALGVVAAIVTASLLRAAFLEAYPARDDEFPTVNVIYYGVLFAAIASLVNLPLIVVWRRSARTMVDHTFPLPPDGQPTEEWVAARTRLEALLHLDVSLLRNPLTAFTILSPLLTSALGAFVPLVGEA